MKRDRNLEKDQQNKEIQVEKIFPLTVSEMIIFYTIQINIIINVSPGNKIRLLVKRNEII